jgi:hypothetical protein
MTLRQLRRIRWAVRAALVLGISASVAANVLHAEPNPIARVIAGWPPVALLIALELVVRIPVARRLGWLRIAATALIAGIAAWVSYWHMAGVAARYGEDAASSRLLPLSVDGLIVVASVSLVELATRIRAAGSPPSEPVAGAVNPAPPEPDPPAEEPVQSVNGHDPARARRIKALADLAAGGDPKVIAAEAGVSVQTVQRWADDNARSARLPRGGPRKPAADPAAEQQ